MRAARFEDNVSGISLAKINRQSIGSGAEPIA